MSFNPDVLAGSANNTEGDIAVAPRRPGGWRLHALRAGAAVGGVLVVFVGANLLLSLLHDNAMWILKVLLCTAAAALTWEVSRRHRQRWVVPVEKLTMLVREIRTGHAPTDELSQVQGNLENLAAEVKAIIHDLRQQRQAVTDLHVEVEQRIANRTSALERLIAVLRQQAARDPLTGLHNRRMLDELLPQLVRQSAAEHKALALLRIDVDHLKEVNESMGHAAGDELMRSLGQIIHSTIREGDLAFRYEGDEFVVLLPGCEGDAATRVSERVQSLAQSLSLSGAHNAGHSRALSIGISTMGELPQATAEALLRRADERLCASRTTRRHGMAAVVL